LAYDEYVCSFGDPNVMDRRWVAKVLEEIAGPLSDLVFLGEGHFVAAWLANGTIVYRFAKHASAVLSLRREACLLPQLAPHLPLKVPRPRYYELSLDPLVAVAAHDLLIGKTLTRQQFTALRRDRQDDCAAQIAHFLIALHQSDLELARRCDIKVRDYQSYYADVALRFEQHMAPHIADAGDCDYVRTVLEKFLSEHAAHLRSCALLHGDLSVPHILWDRQVAKITAIIDFGDMIIADPAGDLAGLYENYGPKFMRCLMRHIPSADLEALLERVYRLYELSWIEWAVDVFEEQRRERVPLVLDELRRLRRDAPREVWRAMLQP
jgi:aminoglycoside 2''-phosphotransferase